MVRSATSKGVRLDDGYLVKDVEVLDVTIEGNRSRAAIRIKEGRKHVVKRIFLAIGSRVYELHRMAIGGLELGGLDLEEYQELEKSDLLGKIGLETNL